jgi:hypothetical protein
MHLHPVRALDGGKLAAADHAADHGHDHRGGPAETPADQGDDRHDQGRAPDGVLVSLPDHKQVPARGADLGQALAPATSFVGLAFLAPPPPILDRRIGSPGGPPGGGPLSLRALSAGDRLMRTSCALLI